MAIDKKLIFWKKQSTFNAPSSTTDTTGSVMWYSIVFFKDTGQIWTNGTYYNCGIWGTPQTNYVPLTIGGTSYNLSMDGHTHSYLPLSGGTISNSSTQSPLIVSAPGMGNYSYVQYNNGTTILGYLGMMDVSNPSFKTSTGTAYSIWHAGNFNPANSVYFNGVGTRFWGDVNTLGLPTTSGVYNVATATNLPSGNSYGTILSFWNTDISTQLYIPYNGNAISWRKSVGTTYTGSVWRTIWDSQNFNPSNYLQLSGGTLTGTIIKDNELLHLAYYNIGGGTVTGMIDIKLPNVNWMGDMYVDFFNYSTGTGGTLRCQIYTYYGSYTGFAGANSVSWTGGTPPFTQVRYVTVGTDNYAERHILIGTTSSTWSFGTVWISRAVQMGNYSSWSPTVVPTISLITVEPTILVTSLSTSNFFTYKADFSNSATKLANTRTIWGQNFNGEGDVTGNLTIPDTNTLGVAKLNTSDYSTMAFNSRAWHTAQGVNGKAFVFTTHTNTGGGGYESLIINYGESGSILLKPTGDGNVGIGTASPSYKLDVNGTLRAAGSVFLPLDKPALRFGNARAWDSAIAHDTASYEVEAFMSKYAGSKYRFKVGFDPTGFTTGSFVNMTNADLEIGEGYCKINNNTVWHAGNDGAGSGLDADTLDGLQSEFFRDRYTSVIKKGVWSRLLYASPINLFGSFILTIQHTRCCVVVGNVFLVTFGHSNNGQITVLGTNGYTQIQARLTGDENNIYFEVFDDGAGTLGDVQTTTITLDNVNANVTPYTSFTDGSVLSGTEKSIVSTSNNRINVDGSTVAFLTDNVASATKLANTRTIWGQNFNGEGNVSGPMYGVRSINNDVIDYITTGGQYFYTMSNNQYPLLSLTSNVGIGTTDPQYKLDVNGSGRFTGNVTAPTFIGNLNGNASTSTQTTATVAAGTTHNLLYSLMADNDYFRVMVGGASNGGYAEIATADDGSEPIYVRQYRGHFAELLRTATLLDENGNTNFPGALSSTRIFSGYDSGVAGSVSCSNWFRSSGVSGWYNETYAGGIWMTDSTYVRVYNSKAFKVDSTASDSITTAGGVTAANFYGNINASYLTGTLANDRLPQRLCNYTSQYSVDPNTFKESGFAYTTTNLPANVNDANILSVSHTSGGWGHQLAFKFAGSGIGGSGYDGKDIYTRTYNSSTGTWTSWYGLLSTGNYSNVLDSRYRPMGGGWSGNGVPGTREFGFTTNDGSGEVAFKSYNNTMNMIIDGNIYVTDSSYQVIHAGNIASQSVNYATSSGNSAAATKSNSLSITGYGSNNLTYYQSSGDFDGNSGWNHYIIANHGDGSSYYHYTIALPFWSAPMYRRQTGSTADVTGWYTFISTENYTNYVVPKSGGTMTGQLILNGLAGSSYQDGMRINKSNISWSSIMLGGATGTTSGHDGTSNWFVAVNPDSVFMINPTNSSVGYGLNLYRNGDAKWNNNVIWHAGNDGHNSGLDADTLDGVQLSTIRQSNIYHLGNYYGEGTTVANCKQWIVDRFNSAASLGVGANVTISQSYIGQWDNNAGTYYPSSVYSMIKIGGGYENMTYGQFLLSSYDLTSIGVVGRNYNNWSTIKWLAFTDSNVASATKLQTSRTIWGQSFNGEGNVSGQLYYAGAFHIGEGGNEINMVSDQAMYLGYRRTSEINLHTGTTGGTTNSETAKFNNDGLYLYKGWFRSTGSVGWYNQTYGGGINMENSDTVNIFGNKILYNQGYRVWGIGGHRTGIKLYDSYHIGINLATNTYTWGMYANSDGNMYFGRRSGNVDDYSGTYYLILGGTSLTYEGVISARGSLSSTVAPNAEALLGVIGSTWGNNGGYPTLYSGASDRWIMHINPHISYVQNGVGGYTGSMVGSTIRFASDTAASTYWDLGIGVNGVGADKFSVGRSGSSFVSISNTGNMTLNGYLQVQGGDDVVGIKSSYYGNNIGMYFGNKLQYQSTSGIKEFIMTTRLYNINPTIPSYAQYNKVPVILWHGRITITSSSVIALTYNYGAISLTGTRLGTGTARLDMVAQYGAALPTDSSNYIVVGCGLGTANTTGSCAYFTIPDTYKYWNNFRIVISDDSTANDGYAEIMIIKVMDPTYYAS